MKNILIRNTINVAGYGVFVYLTVLNPIGINSFTDFSDKSNEIVMFFNDLKNSALFLAGTFAFFTNDAVKNKFVNFFWSWLKVKEEEVTGVTTEETDE